MMYRSALFLWLIAAVVAVPFATATDAAAQRSRHDDRRENVAGTFDYFQLVLSWSPTHCQDNSRGRNDTQCGLRRARPFAFVLHGLWPQYERGYPEFCRTRQRPFVPNPVIDSMIDVMPSRGLIIHQYRKHGTCSGLGPSDYFRVSRAWFKRVRIPSRFQAPKEVQLVAPDAVAQEFAATNPGLKPDMIRVICKRGNPNQLREVRICLTRVGEFRSCSGRGGHDCGQRNIYVPPAR